VNPNRPLWLLLALASPASSALADGDYTSPTETRVALSLGIREARTSTAVRIDAANGTAGAFIDGERDLGLESTRYTPEFHVAVRAGERSRLFFDYLQLDRSDTKIFQLGPANFGKVVLLADDPVQTNFNLRILGLTYGYSVLHGEKFEVAPVLGLNDISVLASVRVQTATRHLFDSESVAGPIPTPGLAATWAPSTRFYVDGYAKYLRIGIDHFVGSLELYEFDALYRLQPNIAVGLGFAGIKTNIVSNQHTNSGQFTFDSKGPSVFFRVEF
jgi:hypothetical protein